MGLVEVSLPDPPYDSLMNVVYAETMPIAGSLPRIPVRASTQGS